MNKFAVILFGLALAGCKCAQKDMAQNQPKPAQEIPCPPKGTCTTQLLRNKTFTVVKDDFGRSYYKLEDSQQTHVVKYEYTRGNEATLPDSGYREEVLFEIGQAGQELSFKDAELRQVKLLYGRFCFCPKDQVGYFDVNRGTLTVSGKDQVQVSLDFQTGEIPQVTKQIRATLK